MSKTSIAMIARHNRAAGKESGIAYFSLGNMRMFGDSIANYAVKSESPTGCALTRTGADYELFYDKASGRVSRI